MEKSNALFARICLVIPLCLLGLGALAQDTPTTRFIDATAPEGAVIACKNTALTHKETLTIPHKLFDRARKKALLSDLLQQSLHDDAENKLNPARETEIRKLAKELSKGGTP